MKPGDLVQLRSRVMSDLMGDLPFIYISLLRKDVGQFLRSDGYMVHLNLNQFEVINEAR
jgi:hypothetical protein